MADVSDIIRRLEGISEELTELSIDRLRQALVSGEPDTDAVAEEKRLNRARRAVEKAAGVLAGMPPEAGDE